MAAVTDTRKRILSDLPTFPSLSSSKKLKFQSCQSIVNLTVGRRRSIHGPHRNLRSFSSRWSPKLSKLGNILSTFVRQKEKYEGLSLEEYRAAVEDSARKIVEFGLGLERDENVVHRKVEDAKKVVESTFVLKETAWATKGPVYKELRELANRRDPKLSSLELELKLYEERLSSIRAERKASEKEKEKEDLHDLFCPLTDKEEEEVLYALRGGASHKLIVKHEASNIEITREVISCLDSGAWLNDEVINLYLELLKERETREPKNFLKCHFFNTFFYKKLTSGKNGYDYNAVRRWTTKKKLGYDLTECDKIFVPIHLGIHWCLAVINVKDETFMYLDSLGGMDNNVLRVLAEYFMDEVNNKSGKQIDTSTWKQITVDNHPQQKNGFDCGMFMLKYADFYSRGLGLRFSQEHMEYFRKRMVKEILRLRAE